MTDAPELKPKRRLRKLRLDEISLVDTPSSPGAEVTIFKRGEPEASDDLSPEMTPEQRAVFARCMAACDAAERLLAKLDNTGLNAAHRRTKNLARAIVDEQIERKREAARTAAEAAFKPGNQLVAMLRRKREKAEKLVRDAARFAERNEIDAVLDAHRQRQAAERTRVLKAQGRTFAQLHVLDQGEEN